MADDEVSGNIKQFSSLVYTDGYKDAVFQLWYNNGKLGAPDLLRIMPIPDTHFHRLPNIKTINSWIRQDFQKRAKLLDAGVEETMNSALIQTKVEMLQRHMGTAVKMQDLAIEYLENHKDDLTSATAVRLLVEGVRIERESVGIPGMLDKMSKKTDEQLLDEVKKLIEESPIEFETIEDDLNE